MTQDQILDALRTVKYPGFSRDIVSFGLIKQIAVAAEQVRVQMVLTTNDPAIPRTIKAETENVLRGLGVPEPKVLIDIHAPPAGAGSSVMDRTARSESACRSAGTMMLKTQLAPYLIAMYVW